MEMFLDMIVTFSLDTVFLMTCILFNPSHLTINLASNKSFFMKVQYYEVYEVDVVK